MADPGTTPRISSEPGLRGLYRHPVLDLCVGDIVQDYFGNPALRNSATGGHRAKTAKDSSQNLAPNKYGIEVVPPGPDCITDPVNCWRQTTTIEGTQVIDAWVRPNEPPFLVEFGPPFWHAFYGFTKQFNHLPGGGSTVTGQVRRGYPRGRPSIRLLRWPASRGGGNR